MAKQQSKRRRKRYRAGSAYAGDVKPTGVLGFVGSRRTIQIVFVVMALALVGGGFGGLLSTGVFGGTGGSGQGQGLGFTEPEDDDAGGTPEPGDAAEVRQYAAPPAMTIDTARRYTATIETELGDIEVELLADQAPATVNNFVFLAKDGFYDGLAFHYVEPGFSAQAGDPTGRGDGGPGYELPPERPGAFDKGTLGMINGSQFFIALSEAQADAERYQGFTPFARIVSGLDVAEQLTARTAIRSIEIHEQ